MIKDRKSSQTKAELLACRNEWICRKFRQMYEVERMRLDDCLGKLSRQHGLAEGTIELIIKSEPEGGYAPEMMQNQL